MARQRQGLEPESQCTATTSQDRKRSGGGFRGNPELAKEAGRRGGESIRAKYGQSHFSTIGKKGGNTNKARGPEYFSEIGRKGAEERVRRMRERQAGNQSSEV